MISEWPRSLSTIHFFPAVQKKLQKKKKAFSSCDFELLEIYNEDLTEILITL